MIEAIPWYVTRSAGIVSLLLLTVATCLGLLTSARWQRPDWPRFLTAELHRTISLLSVVFLAIHVVVAIFDPTYGLGIAGLVPFGTSFRPLWMTLGVVSLYLGTAVLVTSLVRSRLGPRAWRAVHLTSYAAWPLAVLHSIFGGTDTGATWTSVLYIACIVAVGICIAWRIRAWRTTRARLESVLPASAQPGWR